MSSIFARKRAIRTYAVHPIFPLLMVPLVNPFVGWAWMVFNATGIRGPSRRRELQAIGAAAAGAIIAISFGEFLITSALAPELVREWFQLGAHTWLLGFSLVAFALQKRRWDLVLPFEQLALTGSRPEDAEQSEPPTTEQHCFRAQQMLAQGWLLDAEREAREAVAQNPSSCEAVQVLAELLVLQARWPEAIEVLENATGLCHDSPELVMLLATALNGAGAHARALRVLSSARLDGPDERELELVRAETLAMGGALEAAEEAARHLAASDPYDADAQALVADILLQKGQLDDVRIPARNALRRVPQHSVALHALGGARARRTPILSDWWRMDRWFSRNGRAWGTVPYLLAFALFELAPLVGHPGPRRVGVALAIGFALFSIWGTFSYNSNLRSELDDVGL